MAMTTTVAAIAKRSKMRIAISRHQRIRMSVCTSVGDLYWFCCCSNKLSDMGDSSLRSKGWYSEVACAYPSASYTQFLLETPSVKQ